MIKLYWLSADGQNELLAGKWPREIPATREDLERLARDVLLEQCGTAEDQQAILAGSLYWMDDEDLVDKEEGK